MTVSDSMRFVIFKYFYCFVIQEVKKEEPKTKEEPKEAKEVKELKDESPIQRRASGNVASLVQRISTYGIPTGGLGFQPNSQPRASKKSGFSFHFTFTSLRLFLS